MAKIRSIKPNFFSSGQIASCSHNARLLFIGLWVFSDDAGVHPASPHTLRLEVFPGDNDFTNENAVACMNELIKNRLVMEYEIESEKYWMVTGWEKHQVISRPHYRYPLPPEEKPNAKTIAEQCPNTVQTAPSQCPNTPGNGNGNENGNGQEISRAADATRRCASSTVSSGEADTDIQVVFDYWRETLNHPKAILDSKRKITIQHALKNFDVASLKKAILGCSRSPFHMGSNHQNKRYDDITLILRSASHIEGFIVQADDVVSTNSIINNDVFLGAI